jgi:predicted GIY-YIG superfamily endonuclease
MDREQQGGWVYIMTNRYRGTLYVGSSADLEARVSQYQLVSGSKFCAEKGLIRLHCCPYPQRRHCEEPQATRQSMAWIR